MNDYIELQEKILAFLTPSAPMGSSQVFYGFIVKLKEEWPQLNAKTELKWTPLSAIKFREYHPESIIFHPHHKPKKGLKAKLWRIWDEIRNKPYDQSYGYQPDFLVDETCNMYALQNFGMVQGNIQLYLFCIYIPEKDILFIHKNSGFHRIMTPERDVYEPCRNR